MDNENTKLLLELSRMVKENNIILTAIQGNQKMTRNLKIVKWVAIVLFGLFALYFVGPMLEGVLGTYKSIGESSQSSSLQDLQELQQFLKDN
ncbi:MAG: hypothetical protein KBB88_02640 [Candidatus Pacebacteria bacterium]|nr:hypothetical protein [Candidatus Paceibacterota bacterium]